MNRDFWLNRITFVILPGIVMTIILTASALAPQRPLDIEPTQCPKPLQIQWMNEAVFYLPNGDTKEVLTTNSSFYFRFGDNGVELGAREDGVIVWRNVEP